MSRRRLSKNTWVQTHKNYLHISAFLELVVVEQERDPQAIQKKTTEGAIVSGIRGGKLDAVRPDCEDVNISFNLSLLLSGR